jgi:3-isopropylmalate/(R)-2-methylmalate dehydratase small subunit
MVSEVKQVTGRGIVLVGNDIDTDRIIPARFLRCVTFDGLGAQVFSDDRAAAPGQHPFDLPQYQGATVLLVNANFGCGSSREHAPQALAKWGIKAVVGESFAEIFLGNCVSLGIPCVTADHETMSRLQALVSKTPSTSVQVDLEAQQVQVGEQIAAVEIPTGLRQTFISGTWDACGQLVAQAVAIQKTAHALPYLAWGSGG